MNKKNVTRIYIYNNLFSNKCNRMGMNMIRMVTQNLQRVLHQIVQFVLEIIRKQTRLETVKFSKICNYIEMTRKEITWVEGVTNYIHKL
jgi:hypothetical protein